MKDYETKKGIKSLPHYKYAKVVRNAKKGQG